MGSIQKNQDLFKAKYEDVAIADEEKAFFQGLQQDIYVLAIGEDWCPDVYNNLPVMARIVHRYAGDHRHLYPIREVPMADIFLTCLT